MSASTYAAKDTSASLARQDHADPAHLVESEGSLSSVPAWAGGGLQRKADTGGRASPSAGASAPAQPPGPGLPLAPNQLARFSTAFDQDLGRVRLHTGGEASRLARSHGALAYTTGSDVVLGDSYVPGTHGGDRLLAHELAHVVQQRPGRAGGAAANGDEARFEGEADRAAELAVAGQPVGELSTTMNAAVQLAPAADPPDSTLNYGLGWFSFSPVKGSTYVEGEENYQLTALVVKNLLGKNYAPELRDKIIDAFPKKLTWEDARPTVKKGEPHHGALLRPNWMSTILDAFAKVNAVPAVTEDQRAMLKLGMASHKAYRELDLIRPAWLTQEIFDTVVSNHGAELTRVAAGTADAMDLWETIGPAVYAVDSIREDAALAGHDGYSYLWPRPKGKPASIAGEKEVPGLDSAACLLSYVEARPRSMKLAQRGAEGAVARKALLDGFVASYDIRQVRAKKGDSGISDYPSSFTAPPYPGTLSIYPGLDLGLYGSTRAEYGFEMALQFPNIISQFQFHRYEFTAFKVPDAQLINAAEAMKKPGREASHWDNLKTRLARDSRYEEADVKAYGSHLWRLLGPPGVTVEPARINAAMRYVGTVVGSLIEAIFDPSYVARFSFGDEGLYIVRCVATYDPGGEMALRRPPSVAWVLLFARSPELLAEQHLMDMVSEQEQATKRIAEIERDLRVVKDGTRKAALEEERARLVAATGGVEAVLTYQKDQFAKSKEKGAQDRVEQLDKILGTRAKLGFDATTERVPATYVNDAGQVIDLLIEAKVSNRRIENGVAVADYEVKDSTTPSSTWAKASGTHHDAVLAAVKDILKDSDYGRGRATILLDGSYEAIDISTVSAGKMFMEAMSNAATILSIIAVLAAPFTMGESLVLLMPAMLIGAVPSAYNIIKRGLIDKTLHADLALAMDIVNLVGAAVGVGAETRAGMQAIKLGTAGGKVLLVLGLGAMGSGVLVMGATIVAELEAVANMPEGLQQAEVMKILSHAMLQAGIMMGTLLAAQLKVKGIREGATFEDWMGSLDEQSRSAIEKSKTETEPIRNLWKLWAEMDPVVRGLLTQCGSFCIPGEPPSKADQARIKTLVTGLSEQAQRTLQGLLHDNREPAAFQKLLKGLEQARTAAPRSKASAKKVAAVEAEILDRGTVANDLLARLSEEGVNTRGGEKPDPQRWARTVKLAEEVGSAGKIPMDVLRQVMDHIRTVQGANPEEVLLFLKRLGELYGKVPGIDKILGTTGLRGRYLDFEGARWACQFLEDNGLWDKVKAFEDPVKGTIDRVVDIRLADGSRIELKSWQKWHHWANASFAHQIMGDYLGTGGFTTETVKWVFEAGGKGGVESPASLLKKMNAALDQALAERWPHYDDAGAAARVKAIKAALPDVVRVGTL
ncbi:MAG: DUF4157 domain-containing protein [Marmoricola sp.]